MPAVAANGIVFDTTVDEPDVDVDVDWYCELALVGLLGFFQLAVVAHMESVAAEAAAAIGKAGVRRQLPSGGVGAGSVPPQTRLSSVTIVPGRMTLHGRVDVLVPFPDSIMFVAVTPTAETEQLTGAGQGTWSTKVSCKPEAKPYTYTETLSVTS